MAEEPCYCPDCEVEMKVERTEKTDDDETRCIWKCPQCGKEDEQISTSVNRGEHDPEATSQLFENLMRGHKK